MNESKIKKLFAAARQEQTPEPPFNFAGLVVSAVRRDGKARYVPSLFDQLGQWLPRAAAVCVVIIGICIATDFYLSKQQTTSTAEVQQAVEDWMFAAN